MNRCGTSVYEATSQVCLKRAPFATMIESGDMLL